MTFAFNGDDNAERFHVGFFRGRAQQPLARILSFVPATLCFTTPARKSVQGRLATGLPYGVIWSLGFPIHRLKSMSLDNLHKKTDAELVEDAKLFHTGTGARMAVEAEQKRRELARTVRRQWIQIGVSAAAIIVSLLIYVRGCK